MNQKILYLFTRTPLHIGAGASVGAIDQPIVRERHTGFPIIPASGLKGTFADAWNDDSMRTRGYKRVKKRDDGSFDSNTEAAWLFGSDEPNHAFAGALQFSEAKLLAFPIRSAKGSFAWITCPLILARAARDGIPGIKALSDDELKNFTGGNGDSSALFSGSGPLALKVKVGNTEKTQIVLEEYTFTYTAELPSGLGAALINLLPADEVWKEITTRLVILSNGMMSYFAQNACEIAQHVRIDDETGTAANTGLFNQENVPSETLFYAGINTFAERTIKGTGRSAGKAWETFKGKLTPNVFQFGGDASTGLGYCTVTAGAPEIVKAPPGIANQTAEGTHGKP